MRIAFCYIRYDVFEYTGFNMPKNVTVILVRHFDVYMVKVA